MLAGMELNEHQNRALWATALHDLADAISRGHTPAPTSVHFWTQWVTPAELIQVADYAAPEPLPIKTYYDNLLSAVTVPTGRPLDLPIEWTYQAKLPEDTVERTQIVNQFTDHNEQCVPVPYVPAEVPVTAGE